MSRVTSVPHAGGVPKFVTHRHGPAARTTHERRPSMSTVLTDDATRQSIERGTASLPDIAGDGVRGRLAALFHRQLRDESANAVARGVLAIATAVAAMAWP